MTIKSDRWIIEQARKGMIEPFESGQVRERDDRKIISYGTSSYGYDVRCSTQFKIFTNIHSATVDPKALMKAASSILKVMSVSFPQTLSRWLAPSNTSRFPKMF